MSKFFKLARPYAKAIFNIAKKNQEYDKWSATLFLLARITQNTSVKKIINNKSIKKEEKAKVISDISQRYIDEQAIKIINLLAENNRLNIFSEIEIIFERLKNKFLQVVKVNVYSAVDIEAKRKDSIVKTLTQYFNSNIDAVFEVDKNLIGGLKIQAGAQVIDFSIKGKLSMLMLSLLE